MPLPFISLLLRVRVAFKCIYLLQEIQVYVFSPITSLTGNEYLVSLARC